MTSEGDMPWSEDASKHFINVGKIHIPSRDEIEETILALVPANADDRFLAVELGVGAGWLSTALLERFPLATVLGLDGSPTMLQETDMALQQYSGRYQLAEFRLEDSTWLVQVPDSVRCFVSSLVIHHLDGPSKQHLYEQLYAKLEPGGAVLIADIVAPSSDRQRVAMGRWLNEEVRRQSLEVTGTPDAYREFVDEEYNWFEHPDDMDMPSTIPDHLRWLSNAGFSGVDVFWARAGHAVYGGYKGS